MNKKEIGEIRRRMRRDRTNITKLYGCFVNDNKEVISKFSQSVACMPEDESEQFFKILKKTMSGALDKNIINISFPTRNVAEGAEHKLLMQLRSSKLSDEAALDEFYQKVIESVVLNTNYLILVGCDIYDVPFKAKDDNAQADASDEVYQYLICAICPVKQSKPAIEYKASECEFHNSSISQILSAPVMGFLFPAFDNRSTNIYNALFYTKDAADAHEDFIESVFKVTNFTPAAIQKRTFAELLTDTLDNKCNYDTVQTVYDHIRQNVLLNEESKIPESPMISKEEIKSALEAAGADVESVEKFSVAYDNTFGCATELPAQNIIDKTRFEIKTPDVSIRVNPDRNDLIETRIIGGVKYILVCADENIEVNGVQINISDNN